MIANDLNRGNHRAHGDRRDEEVVHLALGSRGIGGVVDDPADFLEPARVGQLSPGAVPVTSDAPRSLETRQRARDRIKQVEVLLRSGTYRVIQIDEPEVEPALADGRY